MKKIFLKHLAPLLLFTSQLAANEITVEFKIDKCAIQLTEILNAKGTRSYEATSFEVTTSVAMTGPQEFEYISQLGDIRTSNSGPGVTLPGSFQISYTLPKTREVYFDVQIFDDTLPTKIIPVASMPNSNEILLTPVHSDLDDWILGIQPVVMSQLRPYVKFVTQGSRVLSEISTTFEVTGAPRLLIRGQTLQYSGPLGKKTIRYALVNP